MKVDSLPYDETGFFSSLMCDYLDRKENLRPYYENFPDMAGFKRQIALKKRQETNRSLLVKVLEQQYAATPLTELTAANIRSLSHPDSFTVTTGHQLNLFTGPLYFLYKIITVINLTKRLKKEFPDCHFVPVYWMASEDHDIDEINHFSYKGVKHHWTVKSRGGATGRLQTDGLKDFFNCLSGSLGKGHRADYLKQLFKEAYLKHDKLAAATRYLVNTLFGDQGLVILDGDDVLLKREFVPLMEDELLHQTAYKNVIKTSEILKKKGYKIQANPREINLFYLTDTLRDRIVRKDGIYNIKNSMISFAKQEILSELHDNPERFSPNVIMRPLYQEKILPNLCYIGGAGELAYWLQLRSYFKATAVVFPALLLRNSALILSEKQSKKLKNLNISTRELFLKTASLVTKKIKENSDVPIDLSVYRQQLEGIFSRLEQLAWHTEKSFSGAVRAQRQKQLNGFNKLEKRLLKAQKRKMCHTVERIKEIHWQLFPNTALQEREHNFCEYYTRYGASFIKSLSQEFDPLLMQFYILEMND